MKELIIRIKYNDESGYKGHGDDTPKLIKSTIENAIEIELVDDGVIQDFSIEQVPLLKIESKFRNTVIGKK